MQDLLYASSSITCANYYQRRFKLFLLAEKKKTRNKLTPIKIGLELLLLRNMVLLRCWSSLTMLSYLSHFRTFSKRLCESKHSYLSQMTTKNYNQYIKI